MFCYDCCCCCRVCAFVFGMSMSLCVGRLLLLRVFVRVSHARLTDVPAVWFAIDMITCLRSVEVVS